MLAEPAPGARRVSLLRRCIGVAVLVGLVVFVVDRVSSSQKPRSAPLGAPLRAGTVGSGPLNPAPVARAVDGAPSAAARSIDDRSIVARALSNPQVLYDEELAVGQGGWQSRGFTLPTARPIQVVAEGRRNTDKGFTVYVMKTDELEHFRSRVTFQHIPALQGLKIRSFTSTATLPAGAWTVVVQNSENLLRTMVVHLRVVSDPA
ncbi:MAG TPA: hypothetical protein VH165_32900 [Kofleriaceae bacterium]|jgi:hypothetical protein|nr:hypothetical protein [Kofleriaceae bacterium]